MKFIKENAYIFVGALLVLALATIIINSIYAGYQQYKLEEEPKMYGLMYVSPEGEKEYYRNTDGSTTKNIDDIAILAQKKTAVAKAKALLKSGHLEEAGGDIYVVEVVKLVLNPEKVTIPKKKEGYMIESMDAHKLTPCYYTGPMNMDYYSSYKFSDCKTPGTVFKTEKKALEVIERFSKYLRDKEQQDLADHHRYHPNRVYSNHFPTIVERNDYLIENFKVIKTDEND